MENLILLASSISSIFFYAVETVVIGRRRRARQWRWRGRLRRWVKSEEAVERTTTEVGHCFISKVKLQQMGDGVADNGRLQNGGARRDDGAQQVSSG
ncbi:hypothetical protein A2U01_0037870, partial [Trifolium medium]|nr:hypothetical protein [Trifolium medium]